MKTYIQAHGFENFQLVVYGYKEPTVPTTNEREIKLGKNNSKSTNALEEREDLDSISMDELHGIFTAYEIRTEKENPDVKETVFKASKRSKKKKKEQE